MSKITVTQEDIDAGKRAITNLDLDYACHCPVASAIGKEVTINGLVAVNWSGVYHKKSHNG